MRNLNILLKRPLEKINFLSMEEEKKVVNNPDIGETPNCGKPENKPKKKVLKYVINIVLVLVVTVVALVLTLSSNVNQIFAFIGNLDWRWFIGIVALLASTAAIRSLVLFCFARLYTRNYNFGQALACDQIGVFYSAVTPGASGGQIMQAYTYKKQGVQISNAVSVLAMYSIVYQVIIILFGLVSFIAKYNQITEIGAIPFDIGGWKFSIPIWPLTIFGFLLNLMVILLVLLMGYWHGFHNFICGPVITFLHKIKIVKNPDHSRENLRIQVENFKVEFRRLITNIPLTILVAILFILYWGIYSATPYFVGGALHNESIRANFFDAIFLSNYHQMVTGIIPIPGAAGISEYFFLKLFFNPNNPAAGFFYKAVYVGGVIDPQATVAASESLARAALLLWRTVTFTLPLIVSGFVTAFYRASPKDEDTKTARSINKDTLLRLQNETLVLRQEDLAELQQTVALNMEAIKNKLKPKPLKKKNKNLPPKKEHKNIDFLDLSDDVNEEDNTNKDK